MGKKNSVEKVHQKKKPPTEKHLNKKVKNIYKMTHFNLGSHFPLS